jgi:hypothetical protein
MQARDKHFTQFGRSRSEMRGYTIAKRIVDLPCEAETSFNARLPGNFGNVLCTVQEMLRTSEATRLDVASYVKLKPQPRCSFATTTTLAEFANADSRPLMRWLGCPRGRLTRLERLLALGSRAVRRSMWCRQCPMALLSGITCSLGSKSPTNTNHSTARPKLHSQRTCPLPANTGLTRPSEH